MTISNADLPMFMLACGLIALACVLSGYFCASAVYGRMLRRVERQNDQLEKRNQSLMFMLADEAYTDGRTEGPPVLDEEPFEYAEQLKESIDEVSHWETDPNHELLEVAASRINGDVGKFFRVGHKLHKIDHDRPCPHLSRAIAPVHLWAYDTNEVRELAEDLNLDPCKTCKPLEETSEDAVAQPKGTVPSEGEDDGAPDDAELQRTEPGDEAADEAASGVGDPSSGDGAEESRGSLGPADVHASAGS